MPSACVDSDRHPPWLYLKMPRSYSSNCYIQPDIRSATKDIAIEQLTNDLKGIDEQIAELNDQRSNMIFNEMEKLKPSALEIKKDPSFIKFQNPKDESSIYDALKSQKRWTGGLQYMKQVTEFKRRMREMLKGS